MTELPAAVLHGTAMWILLTAWSAAAAAVVAWTARRRRVRHDAGRRRARLGTPADDPAGWCVDEPLALAGRLELGGAACRDFEDGRPVAAATAGPARDRSAADRVHARGDELALAVAGRRVRLDGPLDVVVGSREGRPLVPPRWLGPAALDRLAAATPDDEALARIARRRLEFRSLAPGDAVRVRGVLRGGPEQGWRLVGEGGAPLRAACEDAPRSSRPARPLLAAALWGLLAGAAAWWALGVAGDVALAAWEPPVHLAAAPRVCATAPPSPLDSTALQLAALTPSRREETLDLLYEELVRGLADCPGDRRLMDQLEALGGWLGRCRRTTDVLARHGSPARTVELGAQCGDPESLWTAADAALRDGDPARASALFERLPAGQGRRQDRALLRPAQAHLAAGRPELAARALHALVETLRRRPPSRRPPKASLTRLRCLGWALEARRGVPGAQAELEAAARGPTAAFCGVLLADLLPGPERLEVLEDVWSASPEQPLLRLAELLELEVAHGQAGYGAREVDPFERRLDDVLSDAATAVGVASGAGALARHVADAWDTLDTAEVQRLVQPVTRAGLQLEAAGFAAAVGELDEARRRLVAALADLDAGPEPGPVPEGLPPGSRSPRRADAVRVRLAAVELQLGEDRRAGVELARAEGAWPTDRWLAPLRALLDARAAGRLVALEGIPVPDPTLAEAWRLAVRGDAAGLAELVDRPRSGVPPPLLAPAAAWMGDGRATLLELLRDAVPSPCAVQAGTWSVGRAAACHAACGRLARALGDAVTALRYEGVAERLRAPLLDRARIVPLVLLESW
ncbi:MAG: hypothetical protein JXB32_15460 [Deltaproteobacteria bacterium]|nr:hypothetical protein [Deltaproteobacteria bacterium]